MRMGAEVYHALKGLIKAKYGACYHGPQQAACAACAQNAIDASCRSGCKAAR